MIKKLFGAIPLLVLATTYSCGEAKNNANKLNLKKAIQIEEDSIFFRTGTSYFPKSNKTIIRHINEFNVFYDKYVAAKDPDTIALYKEKINKEIYYCGVYGSSTKAIFNEAEDFRDDSETFIHIMELTKLLYYKTFTSSELGSYTPFNGAYIRKDTLKDHISVSLGAFNAHYPAFVTICSDTIYEDAQGIVFIEKELIKSTDCPIIYFYKSPAHYSSFEITQ